MTQQSVTTWYLEQRDRALLKPSRIPESAPLLSRAEVPSPALNRYLYTHVGGDWHWRDRLSWTYERWMQWLDRREVQTWVMYERGTPAGYFELEKQAGDDVEIAYFGVAPEFIGRRLGGHLLTVCLSKAWDLGAKRVWVHTCSLDHAAALKNYQSRGMTLYKTETHSKDVPEQPIGLWPGVRDG